MLAGSNCRLMQRVILLRRTKAGGGRRERAANRTAWVSELGVVDRGGPVRAWVLNRRLNYSKHSGERRVTKRHWSSTWSQGHGIHHYEIDGGRRQCQARAQNHCSSDCSHEIKDILEKLWPTQDNILLPTKSRLWHSFNGHEIWMWELDVKKCVIALARLLESPWTTGSVHSLSILWKGWLKL